jgi:hypothetical protein
MTEIKATRNPDGRGKHRPGLFAFVTVLCSLSSVLCLGQYTAPYCGIQGKLSSSGGLPAQNATLAFQPSQVFFVGGSSIVVTGNQCATDINGSVVGIGNPVSGPRVTPQFTGALPPSSYWVKFTWYDQFGTQSLPSPEVAVILSHTGELQIMPPVGAGPPQAIGMDVYIGTSPGTETYQGQTLTTTAQYTQNVPLGSSVTGIFISSGGLFASCPTAYVFTGGQAFGGTVAAGTPVCTASGPDFALSGVTALTGGNGYTSAPVVTTNLTPITTPTLTATLSGNPPPPITNQTACRVVCNDAGWPTGTGYNASLTDSSGNTLFSYPEMWQFLGPGSVYNLSDGIPYYHGQVTYPVPVLTVPYNHNPQSISSPLSLGVPGNYYPIYGVQALGVDTVTPAWGVDVEGTGLLGEINAVGGYLVNGLPPPNPSCLGSTDGIALDAYVPCLTSLPPLFYQTMEVNGTALTQRPTLNFDTYFQLVDSLFDGGFTAVNLQTTGTEPKVVTAASAGPSTFCAQWDAAGGLDAAAGPCVTSAQIDDYFKVTSCSQSSGSNLQVCAGTVTFTAGGNTTPTFPAMADTNYTINCTVFNFASTGSSTNFITVNTIATTNFGYTQNEVEGNGQSGTVPFTTTLMCHLHHN